MTELSKEAFALLLREAMPTIVQEMFGAPIEEIKSQMQVNTSLSRNASVAYLGTLLGISGKQLLEANDKLAAHFSRLTPEQQSNYTTDESVISLWNELSDTTPSAPESVAAPTNGSYKVDSEGNRVFSFAEAAAINDNPDADPALVQQLQEAYLLDNVAEPEF